MGSCCLCCLNKDKSVCDFVGKHFSIVLMHVWKGKRHTSIHHNVGEGKKPPIAYKLTMMMKNEMEKGKQEKPLAATPKGKSAFNFTRMSKCEIYFFFGKIITPQVVCSDFFHYIHRCCCCCCWFHVKDSMLF